VKRDVQCASKILRTGQPGQAEVLLLADADVEAVAAGVPAAVCLADKRRIVARYGEVLFDVCHSAPYPDPCGFFERKNRAEEGILSIGNFRFFLKAGGEIPGDFRGMRDVKKAGKRRENRFCRERNRV
jgi:hypothetical protein